MLIPKPQDINVVLTQCSFPFRQTSLHVSASRLTQPIRVVMAAGRESDECLYINLTTRRA